MKKSKQLKKLENKNNKNTFDAKVDIVEDTRNIQYYSYEREDYTELALVALENNVEAIRYISPLARDYKMLCEKAIKEDSSTFKYISESSPNYKELGIKAIINNPHLVLGIDRNNRNYFFFWKLAISQCYSILYEINEKRERLYPLIATALDQEPNAIYYVNSNIPVYGNLCKFARSKDKESVVNMDINKIDEKYALEAIELKPEKIEYLSSTKEIYKTACKKAISLNGNLINNVDYMYMIENLDFFFELIEIAKDNAPEIVESPRVLFALVLKNRQNKMNIINQHKDSEKDISEIIKNLDSECEKLYNECLEKVRIEKDNRRNTNNFAWRRHECPIKIKTNSNQQF